MAGKEVLLKAVALALPTYTMSCFLLSQGVCADILRALSSLWWGSQDTGKGLHWAKWKTLAQRKDCGGLGFKDLFCFNRAMLAKIGTAWAEAVVGMAKYFKRPAGVGLRWRIGDGKSVHVTRDPWLPMPYHFMVRTPSPLLPEKVSDLIDPVLRQWDVHTVCRLFNEEADSILAMALSRFGCSDRLMWHFTKDGLYTVKSGYRVAVELDSNGLLGRRGDGGTSVDRGGRRLWKSIWELNVAGKIRHFIWRCCRNYLAVRCNLRQRGMQVDLTCPSCQQPNESVAHLLFQCNYARLFWFACPIQLDVRSLQGGTFADIWLELCDRFAQESRKDELLSSIAYGLWRLWKCRNSLVFEGRPIHPAEAVEIMIKQQTDFLQTREKGKETTPIQGGGGEHRSLGTQQRSCPPLDFVKINCDGAWTSQTLRGGWGWVIRDASGVFKGAGGEGGVRCGAAIVAEAEALRAGLCAGVDQGWQRVVLESDSKLMIDMLKGVGCSDSRVEGIVHDIRFLMRQMQTVVLSFVSRIANKVADLVAAFASKTQGLSKWEGSPPLWLINSLAIGVSSFTVE
ncbi:unnamed protein product [Prunus armeniaca]